MHAPPPKLSLISLDYMDYGPPSQSGSDGRDLDTVEQTAGGVDAGEQKPALCKERVPLGRP